MFNPFKNYKKVNEKNKQEIIGLIDKVMNSPASSAFVNDLNAMKNSLISQAPTEGKELEKIDEQIIASLMKANELLASGSVSQARTYVSNARDKVNSRVSSVSVNGFKKGKEPTLSDEQLMDILLNEAQDKIKTAAVEYNELKARSDAGDLAARSKLNFVFQKYQIAQQNLTAISNNQNRENIARLAKQLTEEQKSRIASRKFSDEEFTVVMKQYAEISATIAQEGNDVLTGTNTISAVSGAINQNQQDIADAMSVGMQNATFNTGSLPDSLAVPGMGTAGAAQSANASFGAAAPSFGASAAPSFGAAAPANFNPFAKQEEGELSKYSTNQLNGTVNLLTRQIEDKEDRLAELKSERAALDKKMTKLLSDYQTLPPVKAKVLEPEIRAAKSRIDSSNFQLNNVNQEIIQLNNNLSMVQKMLSLKERENSSKAVNQTMGGKLDLKGLSMDIANQVNKNNESVKLSEDVNVVSNADNIEFGSGAIDLGSFEDVQKSNEFDDLMKMYDIGEKKNG